MGILFSTTWIAVIQEIRNTILKSNKTLYSLKFSVSLMKIKTRYTIDNMDHHIWMLTKMTEEILFEQQVVRKSSGPVRSNDG